MSFLHQLAQVGIGTTAESDDDDDFWEEKKTSQQPRRTESRVTNGNAYGGGAIGWVSSGGGGGISSGGGDSGTSGGFISGLGSGHGDAGGGSTGGGDGESISIVSMETTAVDKRSADNVTVLQAKRSKAKLRKSVMFSDDRTVTLTTEGNGPGEEGQGHGEEGHGQRQDIEMVAGWATAATTPPSVDCRLSGTGGERREIMMGRVSRDSSEFEDGDGGVSNRSRSDTSSSSSSSSSSDGSSSNSNSSNSGGSRSRGGGGIDDGDDNDDDVDGGDDVDDDGDDVHEGGGGGGHSSATVGEGVLVPRRLRRQRQRLPRRKKTATADGSEKQEEEEEEEEEEVKDEEEEETTKNSSSSSISSSSRRRRWHRRSGRRAQHRPESKSVAVVDTLLEERYGQLIKLCLQEIEVDDDDSRRHIHAKQMEQLYSTYVAVGNRRLSLTPVALYPHGWPHYVTRRLFYPPPPSAAHSSGTATAAALVRWECSGRLSSGYSTSAFTPSRSRSLGENMIGHEMVNNIHSSSSRVQSTRKLFRAKTSVGATIKPSVNPSTSSSSKGVFDQQEYLPAVSLTPSVANAVDNKNLSEPSLSSSYSRGISSRQKKLPLQPAAAADAAEENAVVHRACRYVDDHFPENSSNPRILKWLQKKNKNLWQQKREMKVRKKLESENRKIDTAFKADRQLRSSAAFEEWMRHKANGKRYPYSSSLKKSTTDLSQEPKESPRIAGGFSFRGEGQREIEGEDDVGVQVEELYVSRKGSEFVEAGRSSSDVGNEFVNEDLEENFQRSTNLRNWQTRNLVSKRVKYNTCCMSSEASTDTDIPLGKHDSSPPRSVDSVDRKKGELEVVSKAEKHQKALMYKREKPDSTMMSFHRSKGDSEEAEEQQQSFYGRPESQSSLSPSPQLPSTSKLTARPKTAHRLRSRRSVETDGEKHPVSTLPLPLPSL